MKYLCIILSVVLLLVFVLSAMSLEPPLPGELEKYKKDGSYKDRLAFAKSLGNDKFDPALIKNKKAQMDAAASGEILTVPPNDIAGLPSSDTPRIFALLIEFPDYPHYINNVPSVFTDKIFGNGVPNTTEFPYESLKNYYSRSSYNKLTITGSSVDVYGWYMANNNRRYYKDNPKTPQNEAAQTLIMEALRSYDSTVDFSKYDNDGDGNIDYFMVFWTGPDTGWATLWWGWYSRDIQLGNSFMVDNTTLRSFSWQWESNPRYYGDGNPNFNPRIIIHETGHALGIRDYYDYDNTVGPKGGVGGLDMMDGNWGDHNCFSKWLLGWVSPQIIGSGSVSSKQLLDSATNPDCVAVMPGLTLNGMFGEYFMVQNRSRVGNDSTYPTDGLLIWHVDATLSGEEFLYNNSYTEHKLLRLMEADGLEEIESNVRANASDFYVEGGNVFSPTTTPNSKNYAGVYTGVTVDGISVDNATKIITANIGIVLNPNPLPKMHVSDIAMSLKTKGTNVNAIATVTVVNASQPVSGATVSGRWSEATTDSDSGITDSTGKVSLQSNVVRNPISGTKFTFTITNIIKSGKDYDPSANVDINGDGQPDSSNSITVGNPAPPLAYQTSLKYAFPDPGNPSIWIPFTLADASKVVIKIHDLSGRLVKTLDLGSKSPGVYLTQDKAAFWDGSNEANEKVASGIYFYTIQAGDFTATKKMIIQK